MNEEHRHVDFHEIRVKAYELWSEMVQSNGVDFGPWYYWFLARYVLGIGPLPGTPPIE